MAGQLVLRFHRGKLISSEVEGVPGPKCLDETRKFLDGLKLDPKDYDDRHKPEFDQQVDTVTETTG
jgi:hypothetical protein